MHLYHFWAFRRGHKTITVMSLFLCTALKTPCRHGHMHHCAQLYSKVFCSQHCLLRKLFMSPLQLVFALFYLVMG